MHNAIVWQDTRTDRARRASSPATRRRTASATVTGLPLATYFSAPQAALAPRRRARRCASAAEAGEVLFGTIDTWLIWNLTGGVDGGVHVTDVTNASRTHADGPRDARLGRRAARAASASRAAMLPEIRSSSEVYGDGVRRRCAGVPIAGALGDQQAALFGQTCFAPGEAKCTYGTGCFLLMNTGDEPVPSSARADHDGRATGSATQPPVYALEGSIAVTGALVQWLRDNLGIIADARRGRDARPHRAGQRRLLLRAGLLRPVRAALAQRRPRRHRRPDRATSTGATSPAPRSRRRPTRRARSSTR